MITTAQDHEEWLQMEAALPMVRDNGEWATAQETGVKFSDKPHPQSYRPDLPLRSELKGRSTKRWKLTAADRKREATVIDAPEPETVEIRVNAAHPRSFNADIPLRGWGLRGAYDKRKVTMTPAELSALNQERPLRYSQPRGA